ncbi:MAG: acetate--CoA ligase family protein [Candidatus Bathyarchaeia archaeon]
MRCLLEPRSVAIVGASSEIQKVGGAISRNALSGSFKGRIYLVNPRRKVILGHRVYPDLASIPGELDLVEIVVPAEVVPDVMIQAGDKGVKAAIIVSAGFAETGNTELQDKVKSIARSRGIRVLGPNCFGVINTMIDLDLTFSFTKALRGSVAFISQSGAMCCGTLDYAYSQGIGFSKFVNLGNKCDIDEADVLDYLASDPQTKAIALYVEGISDGRRFMEAARRASKLKPLIAMKAGLTEAGARAALSHTASLAGRREIIEAAFKQSGVVKVDDVEDLIGGAVALAGQPTPRGARVGIVTNAGGLGVTVADWCQILGLEIPVLSEDVKRKIRGVLPRFASPGNPVDMTGDAGYNQYRAVSEILLESGEIDLLIAIFTSQGLVTSDGPAHGIVEAASNKGKPVLALLMGGRSVEQGRRILAQAGIPVYGFPEKTAKAASAMVQRMMLNP